MSGGLGDLALIVCVWLAVAGVLADYPRDVDHPPPPPRERPPT